MLQSKLLCDTKKEWPVEATIKSHGLLIKGGYIKLISSGIYTLMPLAKRVTSKIENIIRDEMNKIDSQEVLMPIVSTKKIWDMSGRYNSVGSELLRFKDRNASQLVLSMTHEETTVFSVMNNATTYTKYPFSVYQIQTKFRDEARPRAGLIRTREFTMKDAYSFHTNKECLDKEYDRYYRAYENIFKRVGIKEVIAVKSDTGMMGGSMAHEFMLLTLAGEDKIITCLSCDYSANMEVAYTNKYDISNTDILDLEKVCTPDAKTIDDLAKTFNVEFNCLTKAVVYERLDTHETIVIFIRGDKEVNETKLRNLFKIDDEMLVPKKALETDNIVYGFVGPLNFKNDKAIIVIDKSLENEVNTIIGANEIDYHYSGFNFKEYLEKNNITAVDVAKLDETDYCPICGNKNIKITNGIEVGNIFKLGDKYTKDMNMTYLDENSKLKNPLMGCYGIGVGRLFASVIEKRSTDKVIDFPISIAPYEVHILAIDYTKNEDVKELSDKVYNELLNNNVEVLLDDRNKSFGNKLNDSDLVGSPIKLIISKRNLEENVIEVKITCKEESSKINIDKIIEYVKSLKEELFNNL